MTIRCWRYSTKLDSGKRAKGFCLYIELLGCCLEIAVAL